MSQALQVMKRWKGRAKLIAGGTNVIPDMRARAIKPHILVDISHLRNLSYVKEEKGRIRIGGLTTISEMASSEVIRNYASILPNAASQLGNPLGIGRRLEVTWRMPLRLPIQRFHFSFWRR
jgi:carbon-monoxide dehydrogenase medium subunit